MAATHSTQLLNSLYWPFKTFYFMVVNALLYFSYFVFCKFINCICVALNFSFVNWVLVQIMFLCNWILVKWSSVKRGTDVTPDQVNFLYRGRESLQFAVQGERTVNTQPLGGCPLRSWKVKPRRKFSLPCVGAGVAGAWVNLLRSSADELLRKWRHVDEKGR